MPETLTQTESKQKTKMSCYLHRQHKPELYFKTILFIRLKDSNKFTQLLLLYYNLRNTINLRKSL